MANVKDWIGDFLARHRARYGPHDWPMQGSEGYGEYVKLWIRELALGEVSEADADAASIRLGSNPPRFQNEHLPRVMAAVREIREERGAPAATFEDAERKSRSCDFCTGSGFATVWHGTQSRQAYSVICRCPAGVWRVRAAANDERCAWRRMLRLDDVLGGGTPYVLDQPDAANLFVGDISLYEFRDGNWPGWRERAGIR